MGLTGAVFLMITLMVAIGTTAAVLVFWRRLGAPHWTGVLARIGAFALAQVLFLAALAVGINDYFGFYSSWGDLLGTGNTQPVAITPQTTGGSGGTGGSGTGGAGGSGGGTSQSGGGRGSHAPIGGGRPSKVTVVSGALHASAVEQRSGELLDIEVTGGRSGLHSQAYLFLPPQYFSPAYAHVRMPVVEVFPGYPASASNLVMRMHYPFVDKAEVQAGRARPMALLMTNETVTPPRDTECADVPNGPRVATYLAQDLPAAVAAHWRLATATGAWGLMGDSTGGYCAVKLAMQYPGRFGAAVSLSGYYHTLQDFTTGDLYGTTRYADLQSPEWLAAHRRPPNVSVLLTTSRSELPVLKDTERFLALIRPPMQASKLILPSGGHNFGAWDREQPPSLDWLSRHLWSRDI